MGVVVGSDDYLFNPTKWWQLRKSRFTRKDVSTLSCVEPRLMNYQLVNLRLQALQSCSTDIDKKLR